MTQKSESIPTVFVQPGQSAADAKQEAGIHADAECIVCYVQDARKEAGHVHG